VSAVRTCTLGCAWLTVWSIRWPICRKNPRTMLRQLMHQGKGIIEIISQVTLLAALLPVLGYGLWLIAGRPDELEVEE
jgi:hypothetical protein